MCVCMCVCVCVYNGLLSPKNLVAFPQEIPKSHCNQLCIIDSSNILHLDGRQGGEIGSKCIYEMPTNGSY